MRRCDIRFMALQILNEHNPTVIIVTNEKTKRPMRRLWKWTWDPQSNACWYIARLIEWLLATLEECYWTALCVLAMINAILQKAINWSVHWTWIIVCLLRCWRGWVKGGGGGVELVEIHHLKMKLKYLLSLRQKVLHLQRLRSLVVPSYARVRVFGQCT